MVNESELSFKLRDLPTDQMRLIGLKRVRSNTPILLDRVNKDSSQDR